MLPISVSLMGCTPKENAKDPDEPKPVDTYVKDELETTIKKGETLPIGNRVIDGPSNLKSPDDIASEKVYDLYDSLPTNWSYIQGNNKVKTCTDFYSDIEGGGFKFSHLWYGFQSSAFTKYKYVDFVVHLTAFKNKSGTPEEKDIMHVYGYNDNEECILQKNLDNNVVSSDKKNSDITFTIANDNMSYFEFRLNANPHKGSQCYNFGISKITLKGRN